MWPQHSYPHPHTWLDQCLFYLVQNKAIYKMYYENSLVPASSLPDLLSQN
jgi:hypothetical protein